MGRYQVPGETFDERQHEEPNRRKGPKALRSFDKDADPDDIEQCESLDSELGLVMRFRGLSAGVVAMLVLGACTSGTVEDAPAPVSTGDVTVFGSDGREIDGLVASLSPTATDLDLPDFFEPVGDVIDISVPDGLVTEQLQVSYSGPPPPVGSIAAMLHLNEAGQWEIEPAEYVDGVYSVWASSFSIRIPGWFDPAEWLDSTSDWVTGRTDPPADCENDPYGWVAAGSAPADGSFHACVRSNPDGSGSERVEVKIKSNRNMAMWITIPEYPYDYLWVEGVGDWRVLNELISSLDSTDRSARVLLPPGRTMTLGYYRPSEAAGPELVFSSYQNTTTQLASLFYHYAGELGEIGLVVSMARCVSDESSRGHADLRFAQLSIETAAGCAEAVVGALDQNLTTAYADLVSDGRVQLSQGDIDNIEDLIGQTDRITRSAMLLQSVGNVFDAVHLVSDATSMIQDAALAFTPGLNTYTVYFVGSAQADGDPVSPPDGSNGAQSICQASPLDGEIGNQLAEAFACLTRGNQEVVCDEYRIAGIQSTFEYFEGRGAFSTEGFPEGRAFSAFASGITVLATQDSLNVFLHSICHGADQLPIVFTQPTISLLDILRDVAQRGYYAAEGSTEATTGSSAIVDNPRLIWLLLATDYPDGASELADEVLNRVSDADTVLVITPSQIGGVSFFKTQDEMGTAIDRLFRVLDDGGSEIDAIDAFRVALGY